MLLAKSSDFKNDKESILKIVRAFRARNNETFWQVYSKLLVGVSEQMVQDEMIDVLSILDKSNGDALFKKFDQLYLS